MSWNKEYLYIAVVLCIAAVFRFAVLPTTGWNGDPARDLLVSQHILTYNEIPNIGHVASGTKPISYYPPVYYYFLALLRLPSLNVWYVLSVFVLLNIGGLGVFFLIAKRLSSPLSACIATTLFACSSYYIDRQTTLSSMHFILPLFLLGTYFHLAGLQKRNIKFVLSGLFFITLASSINYASLILLPVYILWIYISFRPDYHKTITSILFVYTILGILFFQFARFITTQYSFNTFISPLLPSNNTIINGNIFRKFIEEYTKLSSAIFPTVTSLIMVLSVCIVFFILRQKKRNWFSLVYPLSFLFFTLVLSAIKNMPAGTYYYYLVAPFLFIIISKIIDIPTQYHVLKLVQCILLGVVFFGSAGHVPSVFNRINSYQNSENITDTIIVEAENLKKTEGYSDLHFFQIVALNQSNDEWEGLQFSYFLEQKTSKIFRIYDHYNNLEWINGNDYIVTICLTDDKTTLSWCNEYFRSRYPSYRLSKQIQSSPGQYPVTWYKKGTI